MKIFIEQTKDGSPTAYFEGFESERMHHTNGAFSETLYLYGPPIMWAFSMADQGKIPQPRILSLGMGLGYNEIITAAFEILYTINCKLDSYEADDRLNQSFQAWVRNSKETQAVAFTVYDEILEKTAQLFEIPALEIRNRLKEKLIDQSWKMHGAFEQPEHKYNAILYDFFSTKAMSTFWEEEYLDHFFANASEAFCSMGTYSCTGALKRAARKHGYHFVRRKGFSWKKNSSFAYRKPQLQFS